MPKKLLRMNACYATRSSVDERSRRRHYTYTQLASGRGIRMPQRPTQPIAVVLIYVKRTTAEKQSRVLVFTTPLLLFRRTDRIRLGHESQFEQSSSQRVSALLLLPA